MWRGELRHQLLQKTSDSQLFDKNKLFYELLAGCEIALGLCQCRGYTIYIIIVIMSNDDPNIGEIKLLKINVR